MALGVGMDADRFLTECSSLSLTARAMLALLIFERFCRENAIAHKEIDAFLEHMWKWPSVGQSVEFEPWEEARPALVSGGLTGVVPGEISAVLETADVSENRFGAVVCSLVQILWGSFWGACEDEQSLACLREVVSRANVCKLPPITPFRFSQFDAGNGWGTPLTNEDIQFWKSLRAYV